MSGYPNNAKNFDGFSKKTMSREDRLKGDVDFYTQIPRSLLHAPPFNRGQVDMLAFFRARCSKFGFCLRDKAIKDFLTHYNVMGSKRHIKPTTAQTYLRVILKSGLTLEIKGVNGRDYLIASELPSRMREVMEGFRSELREEADYQAELCRAQAEKAAQDQEAWAELLAYARGENVEPADDEDAKPAESADFFAGESENFADGEENLTGNAGNFADNAENNAEKPAKLYPHLGKVLPPNESNLGGESSYESSLQLTFEFTGITTTPGSTLPRVVEESVRENVIFVDDNLGEQEKGQEEVQPGNVDSSLPPASETPSAGGFDLTEEEQIFDDGEDDPLGAAVPEPGPSPQEKLVQELVSEGMGEKQARKAVTEKFDTAVMQLENLRRALPTEKLTPDDRGKWLYVAIKHPYGPTKGYAKYLEAQKVAEKRRAAEEKWYAAQWQQAQPERILFDELDRTREELAAIRQKARNCVHPDWRDEVKYKKLIEANYRSLLLGEELQEFSVWLAVGKASAEEPALAGD